MSNKILLKFVVAFGVLAMLLIFLGVNYVPRISALSSAKENAVDAAKYAGSDYFERHLSAVAKPVNYAGSDWIERHPSTMARPEELARIKDDVFPVDDRLVWLDQLHELARIKDDVFPVDDRLARLDRLHELARIKDDVFPVDDRLARLDRLHELARIKDEVMP